MGEIFVEPVFGGGFAPARLDWPNSLARNQVRVPHFRATVNQSEKIVGSQHPREGKLAQHSHTVVTAICGSYTEIVTLYGYRFLVVRRRLPPRKVAECSASGVARRAAHNTRRGRGLRRVFDDVMVRVSRERRPCPSSSGTTRCAATTRAARDGVGGIPRTRARRASPSWPPQCCAPPGWRCTPRRR